MWHTGNQSLDPFWMTWFCITIEVMCRTENGGPLIESLCCGCVHDYLELKLWISNSATSVHCIDYIINTLHPLDLCLLYISHCFEEPSFLFWREINCFVKETNSQLIIIPPPFPILDYKIDTFVHKNILNIWNSINVYERNILSICNSFYRKFHKMKHTTKSREKSERPKNTYPEWHLHRFPNHFQGV
jgi:hypothetical protein